MKRISLIAFVCALAAPAMFSGALFAQSSGAQAQNSGNGSLPPAYDQASKLHYQDRQAKFDAKLKADLGLTDDQVKQLQNAMKAKWDAMKTAGQTLKADMKTLRDQVKNKAVDADIQQTLAKLQADRDAMFAAMKDAEAKFEAATSFLTPTQRAKMLLGRMHRMGKRWHGKGHGHAAKSGTPSPSPAGQQ